MSASELKPNSRLRYETCRQCGRSWNVSVLAVIPKSGYLCPQCWGKNRKA